MKKLSSMLLISTLLLGIVIAGINGVYAYDADNPYTVAMNFIVGQDSSFTVTLAGAETTIDFNPTTINSKNVEPDSQDAGTSTPILTITNTGNVNLGFTHKINTTMPTFVAVSYNNANAIDWTQTVSDAYSTIEASVAPAGESEVYMWANFTNADSGTTVRGYQINSTISA